MSKKNNTANTKQNIQVLKHKFFVNKKTDKSVPNQPVFNC